MRAHGILRCLEQAEREAVAHTLAFMSFNASIGRVLGKGSVATFTKIVDQRLRHLGRITCQHDFEQFHQEFLQELLAKVKTAKGKPFVYGQAQKPLNVFLKVFVDWASLPNQEVAGRLRPLLHVPLDSILMGEVKRRFRDECDRIVRPAYEGCEPCTQLSAVDSAEKYLAWQACFRDIYPARPVLLDVLWYLGRSGGRASRKKSTGGGS